MADMVDAGQYCFDAWSRQNVAPSGEVFFNRWLGAFDPEMTGEEANRRLDHVGKITEHGQRQFIRGWETAQSRYRRSEKCTVQNT